MDVPHIRRAVEVDSEDPPVIAMRNVKYVPASADQRRRSSIRIIMFCVVGTALVALFWTTVQIYFAEAMMQPRAVSAVQRISAGICLSSIIAWFVVEMGWGGGSKDR